MTRNFECDGLAGVLVRTGFYNWVVEAYDEEGMVYSSRFVARECDALPHAEKLVSWFIERENNRLATNMGATC